jgi:hypothetical protein
MVEYRISNFWQCYMTMLMCINNFLSIEIAVSSRNVYSGALNLFRLRIDPYVPLAEVNY